MKIPFSPPDISELEIQEVTEALKSGWITTGPKTKLLEQKIANYCNTERAVCLNSATAALELILRLLEIGEGDEVITSAYTYTASASPIYHVGAKIVLVDTDPDSYEMDYAKLEAAITERTKAIIPVDIAGILCDYDKIFDIVNSKKSIFTPSGRLQKELGRIAVVADSAHGIGATKNGKMSGEIADFTSFSFHAVKNITTAEGGAAVFSKIGNVDADDIYRKFQLLSLHGQSKDAFAKNQPGAWEYDIVSPAYKCNMTDIAAAMGLAQLKRYDSLMKRRHEIIEKYDNAFRPLGVQTAKHTGENHKSSGHLYLTRIPNITAEERNEIIIKLAEVGIFANVHYKPLPMMTAYKNLGFDIKDYPNAHKQYQNEITLPLHTLLTDEEVCYIIENYTKILREYL